MLGAWNCRFSSAYWLLHLVFMPSFECSKNAVLNTLVFSLASLLHGGGRNSGNTQREEHKHLWPKYPRCTCMQRVCSHIPRVCSLFATAAANLLSPPTLVVISIYSGPLHIKQIHNATSKIWRLLKSVASHTLGSGDIKPLARMHKECS